MSDYDTICDKCLEFVDDDLINQCPSCGEWVCPNCYNYEYKVCQQCIDEYYR